MSVQDAAAVGGIVSAVAVVASLLFVGVQIGSSTTIASLHMREQVAQTYMAFPGSERTDTEAL